MPDIQSKIITGHLQNVSIKATDAELIASEIYPRLEMPTDRAKITRYLRGAQFRNERKVRGRGTEAGILDYLTDEVSPTTKPYGHKHRITDEDLRDAGLDGMLTPPINMVQDALERNSRFLDLGQEMAVAASVFGGTWVDGNAGGEDAAGLWEPPGATNTFLTDIQTATSTLAKNGVGIGSLRLAMDYPTFQKLKRVEEIREQLKYTSSQSLTEDTLARLLGIQKVVVSRAIYSTAAQKKDGSDFTGAFIFEKNATKGSAFLYHYPGAPGLKTLAAGYQPVSKLPNGAYRMSKQYRREELSAWDIESQEEIGVQIVAPYAGYLWNDTILT